MKTTFALAIVALVIGLFVSSAYAERRTPSIGILCHQKCTDAKMAAARQKAEVVQNVVDDCMRKALSSQQATSTVRGIVDTLPTDVELVWLSTGQENPNLNEVQDFCTVSLDRTPVITLVGITDIETSRVGHDRMHGYVTHVAPMVFKTRTATIAKASPTKDDPKVKMIVKATPTRRATSNRMIRLASGVRRTEWQLGNR